MTSYFCYEQRGSRPGRGARRAGQRWLRRRGSASGYQQLQARPAAPPRRLLVWAPLDIVPIVRTRVDKGRPCLDSVLHVTCLRVQQLGAQAAHNSPPAPQVDVRLAAHLAPPPLGSLQHAPGPARPGGVCNERVELLAPLALAASVAHCQEAAGRSGQRCAPDSLMISKTKQFLQQLCACRVIAWHHDMRAAPLTC